MRPVGEPRVAGGRGADAGFTLIEALVALAIGGFIVATLATVTRQWLGSWSRGAGALQRAALASAGIDRIVADLAAAQFAPASDLSRSVLFEGNAASVAFVRRPLAVEPAGGLQLVRLSPQNAAADATLLRSRVPLGIGLVPLRGDDRAPVVLLRAPYRAIFAYSGQDGVWHSAWSHAARLPRAVRVTIVDGGSRPSLPFSTIVPMHVDAPAFCVGLKSASECNQQIDGTPAPAAPATAAPGKAPPPEQQL